MPVRTLVDAEDGSRGRLWFNEIGGDDIKSLNRGDKVFHFLSLFCHFPSSEHLYF